MAKYKVTLLQFGTAVVEAKDAETAKKIAEQLAWGQIFWLQDQIPILAVYAEQESE